MVAWQQTPCGSLPSNDELVAARLGMSPGEFEQHRAILFRGWWQADDGRLYHPVIAGLVLEMLACKNRETQRKADYRARLKASNVPQLSRGTDAGLTRESGGSDDTGTGTSIRKPYCSPSASGGADDGFFAFWERYPRKVSKSQANKAWAKLKPTGQILADLMAGLERQKGTEQWQKDGGKFIPHPSTWLNGRRWEDETTPPVPDPLGGTAPARAPTPGDIRTAHGRQEVFDDVMGWVPA